MDFVDHPRQADVNVGKNKIYFKDNLDIYCSNLQAIDTYSNIYREINSEIVNIDLMLDVGNGGIFDYDTALVNNIVAVDLFFDELPDKIYTKKRNVSWKNGSALDLPENNDKYDAVLMVMLLHHLVGNSVSESIKNIHLAIHEAHRVLKPGGKLIVVESCIPRWFFAFEKLVFPIAEKVLNKAAAHPVTIQYPADFVRNIIESRFNCVLVRNVSLGKWVIHFGLRWPTSLTPIEVFVFTAYK